MADLRESLAAGLEAHEAAEPLAPAVEVPQEDVVAPTAEQRARDLQGRFAKQEETPPKVETPAVTPPVVEAAPVVNRPSTWKKEYWPLYDKLATGQALSADEAKKLADYTNQRENEFKSGVSTYKAEADAAREIQTAIAPFLPELQRYNIPPGQWIANLGRAHQTLAQGSPQEKLAMFQRLAQEYQVPLSSLAEGAQAPNADPQLQWVTQKLSTIESAWNTFQQRQENDAKQAMQEEITRFGADPAHPHFEAVKDQMAGLLQSGMAQDLQSAYDKAVRLNDEIWQQQQATQQAAAKAASTQQAAQAVAKAKAAAVSPKSASPSATGDQKPKGLRAQLEAGIDAALGGGRV